MEHAYPDPAARSVLKIASTLMLIFGILGVLLYAAFTGVLVAANHITAGVFSGTQDIVGMGLLLAAALAELISGALGLKAAKRARKAGRCLFWGALTLLLTLAGVGCILLRSQSSDLWKTALAAALGAVTPIVYLAAAARLRRARRLAQAGDGLDAGENPAEAGEIPAETEAPASEASV